MATPAASRTVRTTTVRASLSTAAALACCVATAGPATAAELIFLPEGEACADFDVTLEIGNDSKRNTRMFERHGKAVSLTTGAAESVIVSRVDDLGTVLQSVTVPSRGARTEITTNPDGSSTFVSTGNLLLVLFSTDAGGAGLSPTSTTLIAGRTVFTVDEEGVFTVESVRGKQTDICAALES